MPLYDYQCKSCRAIAEVRHGFGDVHTEACAACGGVMARVFNPAGIVFKGSGFYITDSRKGSGDKSDGEKPGGDKSDKSTAAAPAAATPATAAAGSSAPASPPATPTAKASDAA